MNGQQSGEQNGEDQAEEGAEGEQREITAEDLELK